MTRSTLARILTESGRLGDFLNNPPAFSSGATKAVSAALNAIVEDGVTYQRIEGFV